MLKYVKINEDILIEKQLWHKPGVILTEPLNKTKKKEELKMKKHENNKLSMNYSVQKVCNDNKPVWNGFTAFEAAFNEFETTLNKTGAAIEKQGKKISGVSQDKEAVKISLIDKALEVSGAVFAFASDTGNLTLKSSVDFSRSRLEHARSAETLQSCRLIFDQATAVINQLGNYCVDAAALNDLQTKIAAYTAMIAAPRTAITERKGATGDIGRLLNKTNSILKNKMDKLMEKFKSVNPGFYRQYFDARIIVDSGLRHKVTSTENPQPPVS